ncbi:hypothetical protein G7Y89_g7890 [Cudoniella acicularis]|uniref:Apple domain-containing protein n=1 Tax=Cudoniella acicularis TaxID=354080 RepID=A0A8H4W3D5_9HELO|nr:hypothetical protein G7Y89_g7890 [Cudoniella acicularis]
MKFLSATLIACGVLSAPALAAPTTPQLNICNIIDPVVKAIKQTSIASEVSSYCSSLIRHTVTTSYTTSITTVTTTQTTLPPVSTTTTTTQINTATSTIVQISYTPNPTVTTLTTLTEPSPTFYVATNPYYANSIAEIGKRDIERNVEPEVPKPAALAPFASSLLSSACSCIVTPPPATYTLSYSVTTTSVTVNTDGPLSTNTIVQVSVLTTTTLTTTTITKPPTNTLTVVSTTTTTPPPDATATVVCDVLGGETAACVNGVIYTANNVPYNQCLADCQSNPSCVSIFWYDGFSTCRLTTASVADCLQPDSWTDDPFFVFSDKNCPPNAYVESTAGD